MSASIHTAYDYLKEGDKVEMEKKRGKGERRRRKGFLSSRVGRRGKRYDAGSGVPRDVGEEKKARSDVMNILGSAGYRYQGTSQHQTSAPFLLETDVVVSIHSAEPNIPRR